VCLSDIYAIWHYFRLQSRLKDSRRRLRSKTNETRKFTRSLIVVKRKFPFRFRRVGAQMFTNFFFLLFGNDIDYTIKIFPFPPFQHNVAGLEVVLVFVLYYCFPSNQRTKEENIWKIFFMLMMFCDDPIVDLFSAFRFNGGLNFCQLKFFAVVFFHFSPLLNYFQLSIIVLCNLSV
jgi:hypothetical protein